MEEEKILEEVYSKILGFANLLKLKNISFKNKLFAHYLNQNNFNIFYEIKDNKLTIPNEKDLKILNYYYNNQEELWAINSLNSKDNNYFKRVINIGKKALVVYLASTITLGLSGEVVVNASVGDYHPPIEQNIITNEEENENLVLSYEDIVELVNLNPYLSLDEKNLILDQKEYFIAALGYLNNSHVKKMLANLKIEYYPENRGTIQGQYNDSNYTVNIYNATNFAQASKSTITHELSHAFAISPCSYGNLGYGQKTIEALNVIVNNEYFGHGQIYDQSYNCIIPYIRILCEIVDSEILKQAFFRT